MLFIVFLLPSVLCSDLTSLFNTGFSMDHTTLTTPPPSHKVPRHLEDLLKLAPNSRSNRFVTKKMGEVKITRHSLSGVFALTPSHEHGVLQDVQLVVYLRPSSETVTMVVRAQDHEQEFNVTSTSGDPTVLPLQMVTEGEVVEVHISAKQTLLSSHGVEVTSTLHINKVLNLRQHPHLTLHYQNTAVTTPAARAARRHFLQMVGQTDHHRSGRSTGTSFTHCNVQDLTVNFAKIGLTSIVAPVDFNARTCSGTCHLDHEDTPMTNHAFIKNMLYFSGEEGAAGASCVAEETRSLTVLVAVEGEYHLTVYEDMVVESCSCR